MIKLRIRVFVVLLESASQRVVMLVGVRLPTSGSSHIRESETHSGRCCCCFIRVFVVVIRFIEASYYRSTFYFVGCLMLTFVIKRKLSEKFHFLYWKIWGSGLTRWLKDNSKVKVRVKGMPIRMRVGQGQGRENPVCWPSWSDPEPDPTLNLIRFRLYFWRWERDRYVEWGIES